eukprot:CAMPEP_0197514818 /NCGR_PEP_ID=MMETSP1318-20131121/139_1 /TAXON_ID=552666 /ORGANISM="Partenskyella glossopodia, Strain RCC365" /LENGTH=533 /DNA_ID=CAMNT_0043063019 /DNA_START=65 /DNA_END=1666 /DNA_ORIENTATION=-
MFAIPTKSLTEGVSSPSLLQAATKAENERANRSLVVGSMKNQEKFRGYEKKIARRSSELPYAMALQAEQHELIDDSSATETSSDPEFENGHWSLTSPGRYENHHQCAAVHRYRGNDIPSSDGEGEEEEPESVPVCGRALLKKSLREMSLCVVRRKSNPKRAAVPALIFDIDGVFKNGAKYANYGVRVLRKLKDANVPYVFMTNGGGGRTEAQYATEMNKKLVKFDSKHEFDSKHDQDQHDENENYVSAGQMVLSYTPFKQHLSHLKNQPVLIVGCPRSINAARSYGFKKAISIKEYTQKHPTMNPFGKSGCEKDDKVILTGAKEQWDEGIKAVLVFTDPADFFEGIQVLTDVLLSSRPGEIEYEKDHRIPIVFSNPDLLWKTQYPHSRFGQGAFRLSLEACYKARMQAMGISSAEIEDRLDDFCQFGKPFETQFLHARKAALQQADRLGCSVSKFYIVGDNPRSDIAGAVNMNRLAQEKQLEEWSGLLVRTGVFQEGDDEMGASHKFDSVVEAVEYVLATHEQEIACGVPRRG